MGNNHDLHADFLKKFTEVKISLSAFRALRPPQCILAGPKNTHNVCVCKIHGNIRLKFRGVKQAFASKNINLQKNYKDFFDEMICECKNENCFLQKCENCPGTKDILQDLKANFERLNIENIMYFQSMVY